MFSDLELYRSTVAYERIPDRVQAALEDADYFGVQLDVFCVSIMILLPPCLNDTEYHGGRVNTIKKQRLEDRTSDM